MQNDELMVVYGAKCMRSTLNWMRVLGRTNWKLVIQKHRLHDRSHIIRPTMYYKEWHCSHLDKINNELAFIKIIYV